MQTPPYNLADFRNQLSNGRLQNTHILISNFCSDYLKWVETFFNEGDIMNAQGNAFVIPPTSCTTLGNYTSTQYSQTT